MLGERYVVTKGDNLWKIAARTLGSGKEWPRIWRYNNRRDVIAFTGAALPDPDHIPVGRVVLIPKLPNERITAALEQETPASSPPPALPTPGSGQMQRPGTAGASGALSQQLETTAPCPISFKFRTDYRLPPTDIGNAIVEVRMTGDVLLMTKRRYPAVFLGSRGDVELQVTQAANHAYGKLVSDNRYIFEPVQKRITFRSMLVSQSNTPNAPSTAIGFEVSSNSPVPKLRAEIRIPKLEGGYGPFNYIALDTKLVIEITPKPQNPRPPGPPGVPQLAPQALARPQSDVDWGWVIGGGLVTAGVVIVVGTIIEDFVTAGAGAADDPVSFSAAAAAMAKGLAMIGGASVILPRAQLPASIEMRTTIVQGDAL
jgi:hypothetical protein